MRKTSPLVSYPHPSATSQLTGLIEQRVNSGRDRLATKPRVGSNYTGRAVAKGGSTRSLRAGFVGAYQRVRLSTSSGTGVRTRPRSKSSRRGAADARVQQSH